MTPAIQRANVITVTYNNESTIEGLLLSLKNQGDAVAHVVVVDNGSRDSTAARVEGFAHSSPFPMTLLRNSNEGFARGYLRGGALQALDEAIPTLCVNPDLQLSRGVLTSMLHALAVPRVGIVTAPLVDLSGRADSASVRTLPSFGGSAIYATLGKFTPERWRYNRPAVHAATGWEVAPGGVRFRRIEATTGALMLVSPNFRRASEGIFDTDYWMYGEDLQLCLDASRAELSVVMIDAPNSIHLKGVSSGWPRSWRSDKEFHRAMTIYYSKNLSKGSFSNSLVAWAVTVRMLLSQASAAVVRGGRRWWSQKK